MEIYPRRRVRVAMMVVMIACANGLAAASTAAAADGRTGATGSVASNLSAVFDSPNEASSLQQSGCAFAQSLPSPPVPNQIPQIICALRELNYAYRTVYLQPNGTKLMRITRAIVGVPTPIDVNGDGVPDFVGTLTPSLNGNQLTLDISRAVGFSATARASIEAVAVDPAAPQTYVGAGEDGLAAGTDAGWSATVTFVSNSTAGSEVSITQKNRGAPATIATLGEVFSGASADAPTNVNRGDVSFSPAPASVTTDVKLGQSSQHTHVTSTSSSLVIANVSLISPGDDKEITATINRLATSVDVNYTHPSAGETKITYGANAPVGQFSGRYQDIVNGSIATAATLEASGVPSSLTVDQVGSRTTITTPSGASIGSVEARYGSGRDVSQFSSGTAPYAAYHAYADGTSTAGVRVPKLHSLTLDAAEPFYGDLVLSAPLGYVGLSALDDVKGIGVSGHLTNLPQHTTVGIALDTTSDDSTGAETANGTVTFNGHNAGIGEIAVDITRPGKPFVGRANEIVATIDRVPTTDTVKFGYDDSGTSPPTTTDASATATAPIGSISVLASDGSSAAAAVPTAHSSSGIWYSDAKSAYYAFARIDNLTSYSVSLRKDATDSITALSGAIGTGGQDLTACPPPGEPSRGQDIMIAAQTDGSTFGGTIDSLPTSVSFSYGKDGSGAEVVDYQASAPIQQITADGTGLSAIRNLSSSPDLGPQMDTFHAEIDCLPAHLTLTMSPSSATPSGETKFDTYGSYIGHVIVQVYDHTIGPPSPADVRYPDPGGALVPAPSGDQLAYDDPGTKGIGIDLQNVGGFDFYDSSGVLKLAHDFSSATPLAFHYFSIGATNTLGLSGTIDRPQPGTLTVNHGTDGTIDIDNAANGQSPNLTSDGGLGTVTFDGSIASSTSGAYLQGAIGNVAANLDVCADYQTGIEDCSPPWVNADSLKDGTDNPPQIFAVHILPTDLTGAVPTTPLTFSGEFCFGSTSEAACAATNSGNGGRSPVGPAGVFIGADNLLGPKNPLTFNALWLGFGQHTDDCHVSETCGRAWLGLDTTNEGTYPAGRLAGSVRYYESNSNDTLLTFNTDSGGYLAATDYYLFVQYNLGLADPYSPSTNGNLTCGSGGQQSALLNEGPGIDLLTNAAIGACP